MKEATWPRVTGALGENVVLVVPLMNPYAAAQRIELSCTEPAMSVNGFGEFGGQANRLGSRGGAAAAPAGAIADVSSAAALMMTATASRARRASRVMRISVLPLRRRPHARTLRTLVMVSRACTGIALRVVPLTEGAECTER
jgi:hypothetical protein